MTLTDTATSTTRPTVQHGGPEPCAETQALLALMHDLGWGCSVLGQGPLPAQSVRLGDWLVVPVHEDSTQIPARALERVQTIFEAGFRPKGFVLVHEAPEHILPAPADEEPSSIQGAEVATRIASTLKRVGTVLGPLAIGLALVAGLGIAAIAIAVIGAILIIPAAMMVGAVALDPILAAVTEDGYWIEIDRWDS